MRHFMLVGTPAFDSAANKGLGQVAAVRNKSEAMGSTDFQRRLAWLTKLESS
jgi:hypothetical protein